MKIQKKTPQKMLLRLNLELHKDLILNTQKGEVTLVDGRVMEVKKVTYAETLWTLWRQ